MNEGLEELKQVKNQITKLKQDINDKLKSVFNDTIKKLFQDNPELESIRWSQYTPYFNDGDQCIFRSNHYDYFRINDRDEYNEHIPDELTNTYENVREFMSCWDDDDMLTMFGDHAEVTIGKDGNISIETYDHD